MGELLMKLPKGLKELARQNGVTTDALYKRIERGMPYDEAATKPLRSYPNRMYDQYRRIAEKNGVSAELFRLRRHKGMTPEEAASKPNPRAVWVKPGTFIMRKEKTYEVKEVIRELNEVLAVHVDTGEEVFFEKGSYTIIKN
jgi:hypothetical protein